MTGLIIDIVKIVLLWNILSVYKNIRMFLKAVKERRLNFRTPNTSTGLSVNLVDYLGLNFPDCRAEMCVDLYEEVFCQYEFQLSLS